LRRRDFLVSYGGAVALLPMSAHSQQPRRAQRIAIIHPANPIADMMETGSPLYRAFAEELRRLGYVEGKNLIVDRRSARGDERRIADIAHQVVKTGPEIIFAISNRVAQAVRAETRAIPIVAIVNDPVRMGFAASLAQPGGNITGFSVDVGLELIQKHIELLREIVPSIAKISFLGPRGAFRTKIGEWFRAAVEGARLGFIEAPIESMDESEYRRAILDSARGQADSIYVAPAPENYLRRQLIAELCLAARLPSIASFREHVAAGALIAYAFDLVDIYRRCGGYVARILKGDNPAAMPFQQPTNLELSINLKTAAALGLSIPAALLVRADEVIE